MAQFQTTVLVNGVAFPHQQVTWEAEIGGDLPGRLSTGSGLTQRKGKVVWDQGSVTKWGWNPLRGDVIPRPGDAVEVWASLDGSSRRVFKGRVDETSGEVLGMMSSTIVDASDDLTQVVRIDPLLSTMPGRRGTPDKATSPGASVPHVAWEALHKAGFRHPTRELFSPYTSGLHVSFYAPLDGTTWSDWRSGYGANRRAGRSGTDTSTPPRFSQSTAPGRGDISMVEGDAMWDKNPTGSYVWGFCIQMFVGPSHNGSARATVQLDDNGAEAYLEVGAGGAITFGLGKWSTLSSGSSMKLGQILTAELDMPMQVWRIWATTVDAGGVATRTLVADGDLPSTFASKKWTLKQLNLKAASGSQISHLVVYDFGLAFSHIRPSGTPAIVNLPEGSLSVDFTPSVRDNQAKSVLSEISQSLISPAWFDADGVFHIEYGPYLRNGAAVGTLTPRTLKTAPWKTDTLMMASAIRVSAKAPSLTRSKPGGESVTAWQGDGSTIASAETIEEFVGPEVGEDWIEPDITFVGSGVTAAGVDRAEAAEISAQSGSVYMTEMGGGAPGDWSFKASELTPWQWKFVYKTFGTPCSLNIPTGTGYSLSEAVQGDKTPIFRVGAVVKQAAQSVASASTSAARAPVLEHDAGIWGQGSIAGDLAKDIAAAAGEDMSVVFDTVDAWWNPAVDVGQVWSLDLTEPFEMRVSILVLSMSQDHTDDKCTITFRILRYERTWPTWQQVKDQRKTWQQVLDGGTWDQTMLEVMA